MDSNNYSTANARLTFNLPHTLINDSNTEICRDLQLPLPGDPRTQRPSQINQTLPENKKLIVTPNQIMTILCQLQGAKATRNKLDSMDIFVKLATSYAQARLKNSKMFVKP